jgi:hypothetical protein
MRDRSANVQEQDDERNGHGEFLCNQKATLAFIARDQLKNNRIPLLGGHTGAGS